MIYDNALAAVRDATWAAQTYRHAMAIVKVDTGLSVTPLSGLTTKAQILETIYPVRIPHANNLQ